ncbi:MAG: hypothetical protein KDK01_11935 [Rhodobacteraceae bacterium]|jgi:hypothetical protein|nr:hypothetical protein [Paracoccaceae bacterium]
MASADYLRRMESVLAAKAEDKVAKERRPLYRVLRIIGALAGSLALFFVLKAAALAYSDTPLPTAPAAEAGIGAQVQHWIAGADPISRTLALAMRQAPAVSTDRDNPGD